MESDKKNAFLDEKSIETINKMLKDMKYGSITIILQDGKIVQIDKTEKHRL